MAQVMRADGRPDFRALFEPAPGLYRIGAPEGSTGREITDGRRIFLSTLPAGHGERRLALAVVLVSVVVFLTAAPFAKVPLAQVSAFIPIYESALVINDLITAVLLFGQFSFLRSRALLVLASGYLFTAFMTVSHALTFPGLFSPTGLLGAGSQSTAWLYIFWHGGFPLLVTAYALVKDKGCETSRQRACARLAILSSVTAVLVAVCGLTLLTTAGQNSLPAIMRSNHYTSAMIIVVSSVWVLSLVALVILWWRRPRSVLDLWLMVVMCAWLFDIALAAVLNAGRFDLGFYAGRIYGLLAASFVLMVLLTENSKLYARLVEAHEGERRERQRVEERTTELIAVNTELATEAAERRRSEAEAAAANRAKSEFLSRMSHELRTPLNAVLGFGQLLEIDPLTAEQRESVGHILKAGRHLLGLIDEVLDISRIEAGHLSISLEPVLLDEVIQEALDLIHPLAAKWNVRLDGAAREVGDRYVLADRQRLKQVLLNILSNAAKFNRPGGTVSVAAEDAAGDRLRVNVTDTGPGIPPEKMGRLFTAFDRLGAEVTGVEGTGLGLALSKRLVEVMGGAVGVDSAVGQGSTFWVELPLVESPATGVAPLTTPAPASPTQGTVLYIEDNLPNLRLVERLLAHRPGMKLLSAIQGGLGLELAREHRPGLILLDLNLPDIPGEKVLELLQHDPRTRQIPVVVISADATPGRIKRLLSAGARAFLTKPLDVKQFLRLLDEVLNEGDR
jgi:signal transduction histidine kinase/ActR/RegA family two-component response regulator